MLIFLVVRAIVGVKRDTKNPMHLTLLFPFPFTSVFCSLQHQVNGFDSKNVRLWQFFLSYSQNLLRFNEISQKPKAEY